MKNIPVKTVFFRVCNLMVIPSSMQIDFLNARSDFSNCHFLFHNGKTSQPTKDSSAPNN